MKRPAPPVPSSAPSARVPPPSAAPSPSSEEGAANSEASYFDSFYNYMVDPNLDPNAAASAEDGKKEEAEKGGSYWDSLVGGLEYTKESVGAVVAYSVPSGGTAGEESSDATQGGAPPSTESGATPADGAPQDSPWDNVTRQTTEASGAIGQSLSTWYYGKEAEEEGVERKPGFQDTLGFYAAYMYPPGGAAAASGEATEGKGEQKPVDPDAPYLGGWFLPEEKEGEPPVRVEKVDLDGMVTGFFSGTGTAVQKMADYGPSPPSRVKPPASPSRPNPGTAPSPSRTGAAPGGAPAGAPRRPPSQQVFTSSTKQAPPPRPPSVTKGLVSGSGAAATGRPQSTRPLPKTTPPTPQTKTFVSSSSSSSPKSFVKPQTTTPSSTTNNPPWKRN